MIPGFRGTQMIYRMVQFNIADLLAGGPKSSGELASGAAANRVATKWRSEFSNQR